MASLRSIMALALSAGLMLATGAPAAPATPEAPGFEHALEAATRDLCGRQVAMLGENGFHGDGETVAFKAALIQRLVTRCHFDAVYFEASHYDFLELAGLRRAGKPVTADKVSSAIGWIWNHDAEIQPLIEFLAREANGGRVSLGGLDDQLGSRGEFYSLEQMPRELADYLPEPRRAACQARLHQRIFYDYPQASPHGPADLAPLQACVAEIRSAVAARPASRERDETQQLVANIERCLERDFVKGDDYVRGRDRSMAMNFRWLLAQAPRQKVIVWAATAHLAKDSYKGHPTIGSEIVQAYGPRAFVLGFSAGGGRYRYSRDKSPEIPSAPAGSLEAQALKGVKDGASYVGPARLKRMGVVQAAPFEHGALSARDWSEVMDGVVVFQAERPPHRTDG
ncbi:MAG: erythromycin esterase family protein [Proteobacteria bacterium]|nr:erythromycin esterase family protein [Pseudomonadota bacterium]